MSTATQTYSQLKKATKLANRAMYKNGPKSYKHGQGALLKVLYKHENQATSAELIDTLSWNRAKLKDIAHKAEKNGYLTIEGAEKGFTATLTELGQEIAEKRCAANTKTTDELFAVLSEEEMAQLNALTEKVILSAKAQGAHGKIYRGKKSRKHSAKGCCAQH